VVKGGQRVTLTISPPSVSRMSRFLEYVGASTSHKAMGLHGLLQEQLAKNGGGSHLYSVGSHLTLFLDVYINSGK
jgi:hypothetical protein